jgi:hypothetical protein
VASVSIKPYCQEYHEYQAIKYIRYIACKPPLQIIFWKL